MTAAKTDRWLSVSEVSEHLGVSQVAIYKWLGNNKIPAHKVGRLWKFQQAEVDEWVKSGNASKSVKRKRK